MLVDGRNYAPSMVKFLNGFSNLCKSNGSDKNQYLEQLFESFLGALLGIAVRCVYQQEKQPFQHRVI